MRSHNTICSQQVVNHAHAELSYEGTRYKISFACRRGFAADDATAQFEELCALEAIYGESCSVNHSEKHCKLCSVTYTYSEGECGFNLAFLGIQILACNTHFTSGYSLHFTSGYMFGGDQCDAPFQNTLYVQRRHRHRGHMSEHQIGLERMGHVGKGSAFLMCCLAVAI